MCGRYYLGGGEPAEALRALYGAADRTGGAAKTGGEIFPSDTVPVLASSRSLAPALFAMRWGYALPGGKALINARSETAAEKPLFAGSLRSRRCVVPAQHYFEWSHSGPKTKYALQPDGDGPLCMAGLYRLEQGIPVFCILTRAPADNIAFIHDRMPVILPAALARQWIDPRVPAGPLLSQPSPAVSFRPAAPEGPAQLPLF